MASGGYFNEHAAYSKLVLRLILCGTKVLRRLLKDQVKQYGQSMDSFLALQKQTLLKDHVGKMNTTVLFPLNNHSTDIESWDICLLTHVLTKYCSKLPLQTARNLRQLKSVRNLIAHSIGATVDEVKFNCLWQTIGNTLDNAMSFINDKEFNSEIEQYDKDIEDGLLVQDVAKYQRDMKQWCQQDTFMTEKLEKVTKGKHFTTHFL